MTCHERWDLDKSGMARLGSNGDGCRRVLHFTLKSAPRLEELQAELRDAGRRNMETTSRFRSCLAACQGLNKPSIAARLNGQPFGKIETEGDLIGNGCGGTGNGHQGPTTGVRIEAVDAFEPESATSGDERARGVEAISWASDTPAVAYDRQQRVGCEADIPRTE